MGTALAISPATTGDRTLYICVVASMLLHAAIVFLAPRVEPKAAPPPRITATIRPAAEASPPSRAAAPQATPDPKSEPAPEPPRPQAAPTPPRPEPRPLAAPDPKAAKVRSEEKPEPRPAPAAAAPVPVAPPAPAPAEPKAEVKGEAKGEVKGEVPAPKAAAAPPMPPGEASDRELVALYQNQIAGIVETRKLKRYPNEAMQNNWEGTATVLLKIGPDGKVAGVETASSSGHEMLDEQARISISKAKPFVQIPEGLKGKPFEARVRVVFSLKN